MTPGELATTPAMPHPSGLDPDFNQPTSFPAILIVSFAVSFSFATIFLILRLYTTAAIVRKFDLDDGLIILAWGCSLAYGCIMFLTIENGFGKHLWNVSASSAANYLQLLGSSVMTYSWSVSIAKLAMLALYHRINTNLPYRLAIYGTAICILGYQIAFTAIFNGPCEPTNAGANECLNQGAIAQVILNIIFDIVVIIIPVPTIIRLKMPRKQGMVVLGILALGSGAAIVSAVKVSWVLRMTDDPDFTYIQGQATILSVWEANVSIWCNNLVRLKPFVRNYLPRLYALLESTGAYSNSASHPSRTWQSGRQISNHELSTMRKGAVALDSISDVAEATASKSTITAEHQVGSHSDMNERRGSTDRIM